MQRIGLFNLGFAVGVPAAARQQHALVAEADVIHNSKPVVGRRLLEGPEKVVGGGHQQGAVVDGIALITTQRRIVIRLGNAVKPLDKGFEL